MSILSSAVGIERIARTSGYQIKKLFNTVNSENLPQIIAILGEANTANQGTLSTTKKEVLSAEEAGKLYGHGSPIHQIMRILRPAGQDGVGGIPTVVFAQSAPIGATATTVVWAITTATGPAEKAVTHTLVINGRENLDGKSYSFNIEKDDTSTIIGDKIVACVSSVLSCPVTAVNVAGTVTFTSKWKGKSSADVSVGFNVKGDSGNISYAQTTFTAGTGTPDISGALEQFQDVHYTCVVNSYGVETTGILADFNGVPYLDSPTGRYNPMVFKPFMAFFGSTSNDKDVLSAITDDPENIDEVTNVLCPAPGSKGMPFEASANVVRLFSVTAQQSPEKDVNNMAYPDMPAPQSGVIGDMSDYNVRDYLVKLGCSTVILDKNQYKIQDLVTTYHTEGESPLQYSYARNLNLDWNIADAYMVIETIKLKDKVLVLDKQVTDSPNAIKPKEWKSILFGFFDELGIRALINDPAFSKASLQVQVSATNPNRFETFYRYKRTGIARIESTTVEAGF